MKSYYVSRSEPKRGAGCMIMCSKTGRFLMCKRSAKGPYPNTWATWGGNAEPGETAEQTARREAFEETGHKIVGDVIHLNHFDLTSFTFDTFIATVDNEFKPLLNGEAEDACWMTLEEIPDDMHEGLRSMLEEKRVVKRLIDHVYRVSGRDVDFDRVYKGR